MEFHRSVREITLGDEKVRLTCSLSEFVNPFGILRVTEDLVVDIDAKRLTDYARQLLVPCETCIGKEKSAKLRQDVELAIRSSRNSATPVQRSAIMGAEGYAASRGIKTSTNRRNRVLRFPATSQ